MIDSMILWLMMIMLCSLCLLVFHSFVWLYEPGGILGGIGLKCVKPGFGGFRGYRGF
jgi:hypothetical protein